MRWTRDRSGAATVGFGGVLVAGGMGGESTSVSGSYKPLGTNSPRPQLEVKPHAGELTVTSCFAGLFRRICAKSARRPAVVRRLQGSLPPGWTARQQSAARLAGRGTIQCPPPRDPRLTGEGRLRGVRTVPLPCRRSAARPARG